jgi:phage terminase large subunit-like protein
MVQGESGLLAIYRPDFRPRYEPFRRRLTWPDGAIATSESQRSGSHRCCTLEGGI